MAGFRLPNRSATARQSASTCSSACAPMRPIGPSTPIVSTMALPTASAHPRARAQSAASVDRSASTRHHLEAQFDFEAARTQLRRQGVMTMEPFTEFPHLRQVFTQGEIWMVEPSRLAAA